MKGEFSPLSAAGRPVEYARTCCRPWSLLKQPTVIFPIILVAVSLFLSSCSFLQQGQELEPVQAAADFGGRSVSQPVSLCGDLALSKNTGRPTNLVEVRNIPLEFGEIPAFRVEAAKGKNVVTVPIWRRSIWEDGSFVVPVHPNGSPGGGPVTLTLLGANGVFCGPFPFTIEPLPAGPGAFARMATLVEQIYDEAERLFPLPSPAIGMRRSLWEAPLAIAEDRLRGPGNENSLLKIAAGEAQISSTLTPVAITLMDGLVTESGILNLWAERLDRLRDLPAPPPFSFLANAFARLPGGSQLQCAGPQYRPTAAQLSSMVSTQQRYDEVRRAGAEHGLGSLETLATTAFVASLVPAEGAPNETTRAADVLSLGIAIAEMSFEAPATLLPGEFTDLTFDYDKAEYWEDGTDFKGRWDNVQVSARSAGMDLDGVLFKTVLKAAGGPLTSSFIDDYVDHEVLVKTAQAQKELTGVVAPGFFPGGDRGWLETIHLPPCDFGPVDIGDEAYHYVEFEPDNKVAELTGQKTFTVLRAGLTNLALHLQPEAFGGHKFSKTVLLEVKPIQVRISPKQALVKPGDTASFSVTVEYANDTGVKAHVYPEGDHTVKVEPVSANEYLVTVKTSHKESDFPANLRVDSTSKGGLRQKVLAPSRADIARLIMESNDVNPGRAQ